MDNPDFVFVLTVLFCLYGKYAFWMYFQKITFHQFFLFINLFRRDTLRLRRLLLHIRAARPHWPELPLGGSVRPHGKSRVILQSRKGSWSLSMMRSLLTSCRLTEKNEKACVNKNLVSKGIIVLAKYLIAPTVCHGFSLMNRDDYLPIDINHF